MTPIATLSALAFTWFDWTEYVGVQVAAIAGVAGVILAWVLIARGRPLCEIGTPIAKTHLERVYVVERGREVEHLRLRVTLPVQILPGNGRWVRERFDVVFSEGEKGLGWSSSSELPSMSADECKTQLVYELEQDVPRLPPEFTVTVTYKFKYSRENTVSQVVRVPNLRG